MAAVTFGDTVIRCLYEDESLLAVDKPPNLLSVPGKGEAGRLCLSALLTAHFGELKIVHRLDMATSGIMLFAKTPQAQKHINRQFEKRKVAKNTRPS